MSVFYLEYRPAKLSELDLIDVAEKLKSFLSAKEMPQSFLFAGPKGAGKTSAARILAKTINCPDRKQGEACGKCDNCKEIDRNRVIDIIEMDGASNRGIEDVRSLKEKAYLLPTKLKYKVFIIDEVHMLTKDAFNALLKLIEEPPKHTIFVLCTTDPDKIPDTVLSRLIRIDFRKGSKEDLKRSLEKIIKGEKIKIGSEAVELILEKSDGSFRNLQKHFNELVLEYGNELSVEVVEKFYTGKNGDYLASDFERDLAEGKLTEILIKLEELAELGVNFVNFRIELMDFFQRKLLANFGINEEEKALLGLKKLEEWINFLIRVSKQEKETEIDQLPLELAVIDFLEGSIRSTGEKKELNNVEVEVVKKDTSQKTRKDNLKIKNESKKDDKNIVLDVVSVSLDKIEESWGNILMAVKPFNHSVEAFLRASKPIKFEGRNLTLEVFYPFHKDRLEETKNRQIVEKGLQKILGVEITFDCILGKSKSKPLVIKNDTPMESVNENLVEKEDNKDLYDVAKDIFG
jgi:DNA polymerase-3 subunit gamma/tau